MSVIDLPRPPALGRALVVQLVAIFGAVLMAGVLSRRETKEAPPRQAPKPRPPERMIRVVKLPPRPQPPEVPKPQPKSASQPLARAQPAPPRPPPPQRRPSPPRASKPVAARAAPAPSLSAEQTSVKGVPLRVLIPSDPRSIGAHLASSGGCLVVSRLHGDDAEPIATFGIESGRAVPLEGGPCNGVPRLLQSDSLNAALGDPLGAAARASGETGALALQIILSPSLHDAAQSALVTRFGRLSDEELAAAAAREGYELRCYARAAGGLSCE